MTIRSFPTDGPRVRYYRSSFCKEYKVRPDGTPYPRDPSLPFASECAGFDYAGYPIHGASDIYTDEGRPWIAVDDGEVLDTAVTARGGHTLKYRATDGRTYYYAHGAVPAMPSVGEKIRAGQVVGRVGHTGNTLVNHLHLSGQGRDGRPLNLYAELRLAQVPAESPTWTQTGGLVSSGAPPLPPLPPPVETEDQDAATLEELAARGRRVSDVDLGKGVRVVVYVIGLAIAAVAIGAVA